MRIEYFQLIDRIVDLDLDGRTIRAEAQVPQESTIFEGHFPGHPLMPGVLLIEAMAQTAGAICILSMGEGKTKSVYFLTIDKAKFRRPVVPGDVVELHMTKKAKRKTMWWYRGEAKVAGEIVAEAEVGAMLVQD